MGVFPAAGGFRSTMTFGSGERLHIEGWALKFTGGAGTIANSDPRVAR
jgi:hypothetical protein